MLGTYHQYNPEFFSPPEYYNEFCLEHKSDKEVFLFDLNKLRKADVVVVNLNQQKSIGTAMEVAIAYENRIPIIGLKENDEQLHPWFLCCCNRVCDTMDELVEYLSTFYLN